jgi:4-hydroxy-tetrahydrodipicolinate synthase
MFTAEGDIDEEGTRQHVEYLIESGVHGLVACGTSGEFIAMSNDERVAVTRIVVDAVAGRVPVLAGSGHYSTRHTIDLTQQAQEAGADAALVILPYYQRPPKSAILEHYRTVSRSTDLPVWVYNNPLYAACEPLTPLELAELHQEGVIRGVKSTIESVVPIHELLDMCGESFRTFYGTFQAPLEALLVGGHGWISGFPNFLTRDCVHMYDAVSTGRIEHAKRIWSKLLPFRRLYSQQQLGPVSDLAIYRAGLDLMGQHGGFSRLPLQPLNDDQKATLRGLMARQGILQ